MRAQGRRHCFNDLKRRLRETLKYTYRVWDEPTWRSRVLSHYTFFVNLHKECGDAHNPITFRVPKLLNAEKVVISERCHPKDEAEFDGAVIFADNLSAIVDAHRRLVRAGDAATQAHARDAATRFRRRFQPRAIFRRAGIYKAFGLSLKPKSTEERRAQSR